MSSSSGFSYFAGAAPHRYSTFSPPTTSVLSSLDAFSYNEHVQNPHQMQRQLQQQRVICKPYSSEELRQFTLHISSHKVISPAKILQTVTSSSSSSSGAASCSVSQGPDMDCTPDVNSYLFTITGLPSSITSDMVTISANKGDRLRVNAQAWGDENAGKLKLVLSLLQITNIRQFFCLCCQFDAACFPTTPCFTSSQL
jgi:hypothetical protein